MEKWILTPSQPYIRVVVSTAIIDDIEASNNDMEASNDDIESPIGSGFERAGENSDDGQQ